MLLWSWMCSNQLFHIEISQKTSQTNTHQTHEESKWPRNIGMRHFHQCAHPRTKMCKPINCRSASLLGNTKRIHSINLTNATKHHRKEVSVNVIWASPPCAVKRRVPYLCAFRYDATIDGTRLRIREWALNETGNKTNNDRWKKRNGGTTRRASV